MHHQGSEVTCQNFSRISPSARVERYLLQMQERQLLNHAREYMGGDWRLPPGVDIADAPPVAIRAEPLPCSMAEPDAEEPSENSAAEAGDSSSARKLTAC